ncbi:hypothetical protein IWW34DRAFT_859612 [Fusarium oxysporum f. sp. albedinis]|uniref:Fungal-type protein kinase domain-containing protein n=1 Tax=Fusarium oxysporum f. sp. conglutinans race 2 54008 TaxID=1089457 RepID=X0GNV1_FUSOX|nr:hypothetical protein FOPG_18780 [Fusarium oxysporum f. sp. conglutinans race 2 54008]KAG6990123.1 hypothetical protein FocnCong_v020104 [Fusarium oxysporum f. sp. conglutinans]KAI3567836.1 hypothetical protein IWW34DRAFT_859612 [Fusarium oxysporum f. sp. albedinis]KAK2470618.1 hypothetical protein H9L39_17806 [Fusarium oxysporum f. sp. albedinis]
MPIYKASSWPALLAAFEKCIEGHESLHKAAFFHIDIVIDSLVINEDDDNSWPFVLIDLGRATASTLAPDTLRSRCLSPLSERHLRQLPIRRLNPSTTRQAYANPATFWYL